MSFVKSSLKGKNIKMKNKEYLTKKKEWSKFSTYKVFVKGNRKKNPNTRSIKSPQHWHESNDCRYKSMLLYNYSNRNPETLSEQVSGNIEQICGWPSAVKSQILYY